MLELKGIVKNYTSGDETVMALRGIDLQFRRNDFVSILGPSGCGKTTLLNIIGGLDQYTRGDLIIDGVSTKNYKDRNWDCYRNHKIGFVFQSYNLIPHQSVLSNVELALTLSGVSKAERRKRAKEALCKVGLGDQLKKRPNQMSGGQMQRVAIARALVNDPDIILADEPTGALDTETSKQVMEILKEISKDRLIIMVTHNPDIAEEYSTRIIRMLDGCITSDTNPLSDEEKAAFVTNQKPKKEKMPSMSLVTSFKLSLKNLFTKKGRTILTSFAGSIGIIGIALILSVSQGTTAYINSIQEETLSSYPLTLEASTMELGTIMETFMNVSAESSAHDKDKVYKKEAVVDIVNAMNALEETENDLFSFNEYLLSELEDEDSKLNEAVNGVQYSYDLDMLIYTENVEGEIIHTDTEDFMAKIMSEYIGMDVNAMESMMGNSSLASMSTMSSSNIWQELLPGKDGSAVNDLLFNQYDLVYGDWPNDYDEIVIVLDRNNELDDVSLYALGLIPQERMDKMIDATMKGEHIENLSQSWSYEEICEREYKTILNSSCYTYDETTGTYNDLRDTDAGLRYLYNSADSTLSLKVTGIIRPNEECSSPMLKGSIGYTHALTEFVIEQAKDADVINAQLDSPDTDILTGLPFKPENGEMTDAEKKTEFLAYLDTLGDAEKAQTYIAIKSIPEPEFVQEQINGILSSMTREDIEAQLIEGMSSQVSVSQKEITDYLASMTDEELNKTFAMIMEEQIKLQYAQGVVAQMASVPAEQLLMALTAELETYTDEQFGRYYDEIITFSETTYEDNLVKMGYLDLDRPSAINIYASSFENKDIITDAIEAYNNTVDEAYRIKYTDYIGILMSSITLIIDAITYVLIAFVAISLIVSSIMIGVITLISVQERTKEIGILRAIGASKRNVARMFNAETMIVGFISGVFGVVITALLCIPINAILFALTDIANLKAQLPLAAAIILVVISVALTLISGIIPSRSAAKKDPVVALRTE
ncbi:MAG: ABC transporter ATP-binding protein/permease [Clostridia bacterium]|nr:ABC transporter ATP-binding protein/permease [Clostridia bacterium]